MARKQAEHGTEAPESVIETTETSEAMAESIHERTETTAVEIAGEPSEEGFGEAIREGAEDARAAAAGFLPAIGKMVHNGVYSSFYYMTYGVVFTSMVVGSLIPSNNAMGEGVRDGFTAARKAFEGRAQREEAVEVTPSDEVPAMA